MSSIKDQAEYWGRPHTNVEKINDAIDRSLNPHFVKSYRSMSDLYDKDSVQLAVTPDLIEAVTGREMSAQDINKAELSDREVERIADIAILVYSRDYPVPAGRPQLQQDKFAAITEARKNIVQHAFDNLLYSNEYTFDETKQNFEALSSDLQAVRNYIATSAPYDKVAREEAVSRIDRVLEQLDHIREDVLEQAEYDLDTADALSQSEDKLNQSYRDTMDALDEADR